MEKSEKNIYLSENHHFAPIGNSQVHNANTVLNFRQFHKLIWEISCLKGCVNAFENPCDRFKIVYNFFGRRCGQVIEIRLDRQNIENLWNFWKKSTVFPHIVSALE